MARDVMSVRLHLPQIRVRGVVEDTPSVLVVRVESTLRRLRCPHCGCGCRGVHDRRDKKVRDLEVSGRPTTLVWSRRRMRCGNCGERFLEDHHAFEGCLTARLARRLVADVKVMTVAAAARRHKLSWHVVMALARDWSELVAEHRRSRRCRVLLVDETSMRRRHRYVTVIDLRPDRVEVRSPGGLPDGVTLDNISQRSVARNTLVIRTLRFLGVAEEAGRGVDLMRKHMALNLMHPPGFEADATSVTVMLRLGSAATPTERAWLAQILATEKEIAAQPYSVGDHPADTEAVRPQDVALLVRAARGEALSNGAARDLLGADVQEARGALQRLRDRGLLEQEGSGAGTTYRLSPAVASPDGVSHAPRDHEARVLNMARQGTVTNTDVRSDTGLGRAAVVQILNRLVATGRLERRGSKRGTHYVLGATETDLSPSADAVDQRRSHSTQKK